MPGFEEDAASFKGAPSARAKLFKHGGSQAVRLPKAFRFEGDEVSIRREGAKVILEPAPRVATTPEELKAFWARIDALMDGGTIERPPQDDWPEPPSFDN